MKDLNLNYLIKALQDAGVTQAKTKAGARQTIQYWIREGVLVLRQQPRSNRYCVNDGEVKQIVKEFSPGGQGFWHCEQGGEDGDKKI